MNPAYAAWIAGFAEGVLRDVTIIGGEGLSDTERTAIALRGRCATATAQMVQSFPELRRVRGHYGGREHWWCETPKGEIVDPTAAQFAPGAAYVEHTGPDPYGKCMNCGEYVWTQAFSGACSADCLADLAEEYGG